MEFRERARFVNWLNTSQGHPPAYRLDQRGNWLLWSPEEAWTLGGTNLYRHRDAFYFLSNEHEWYKAAFYDGTGYRRYATGNNQDPIPVAAGRVGGTDVYAQSAELGPAPVEDAGGLSHYGTMGQMGNVDEWIETALDRVNDSTREQIQRRGGAWNTTATNCRGILSGSPSADGVGKVGFRVAARMPSGQ